MKKNITATISQKNKGLKKKFQDINFLKDLNATTIGNKRNVAALRINRSCTKYTRHFQVTHEIGNVKCKVIALQTALICLQLK